MTPRFRVWDGEEMHEPPHGFILTSEGEVCFEPFESNRRVLEDHEVLLSTGLTDAKGNEIWEGDIFDTVTKGVVVYRDRLAGFFYQQGGALGSSPISIYHQTRRVIGNRYEHPELLEDLSA